MRGGRGGGGGGGGGDEEIRGLCVCLKTGGHAVSDALAERGASLMWRATPVIESNLLLPG